jgi:acetylornithine deacetylase/succinyl-diaminopimelate desuccinylase-like protein
MPSPAFATGLLRRDLESLTACGLRSAGNPAGQRRALDFLQSALADSGYVTRLEQFGPAVGDCNLLAECPSAEPAAPMFEIGAHFDTVGETPGADDNGSGVVGLLALARHFARRGLRVCSH